MRVLLAQLNPTIGDFDGNAAKIVSAIKKGRAEKADIVLFPELCLTGYPPEDFLLMPHFLERCEKKLQEIIPHTDGITAIIGLPRANPDHRGKTLFNSAAIVRNGALLGYQDKVLLPTYDVFDESRYFEPGKEMRLWEIAGQKVAVTICEDIWQHSQLVKETIYARDPVKELQPSQPDIVLNLSSSPYNVGKGLRRFEVCARAAKAMKAPLLLCNQVGGNDSLIFDGRSLYLNSKGELISCAAAFKEEILLCDTAAQSKPISLVPDEIGDLHSALVLGLRDYFVKSGFTKACFGLSGGIDSALVACIAAEALGPQNLLAVGLPSRYSSPGSVTDAELLAKNLGIPFKNIAIESPFQSYLDLLSPVFSGREPDVTEENLQARIRGMILMAISNKFGYVVLSTGNKSELAMGYATLYGDMCGGLGVISDVTKMQVYALSRRINKDKEIIPQSTLDKEPSAELRPNQKDSDSLPSYTIIDNVLEDYVEDHISPEAIAKKHGYPLELVHDLIRRIHRNEYKRRQSAPGLRVSEKAFSVGRRFPIVQKFG